MVLLSKYMDQQCIFSSDFHLEQERHFCFLIQGINYCLYCSSMKELFKCSCPTKGALSVLSILYRNSVIERFSVSLLLGIQAEEHDRWAVHFDSLKNHLNADAKHPLNGMYKKQPESLCLSPDPKELTAVIHPFSPVASDNHMPLKAGNAEKAGKSSEHSQKAR